MSIPDQKISKSPNPKKVDAREYRDAVDAAELINVRLIKSEFIVEPEGLSRERSHWKQSYDFQIRDIKYDATRNLLTGLIVGDVSCKVARKRIIGLKSRYLVAYSISGSPSEAAVLSFARRVAAFAAYPYFRSHFAEICSQSGITLPPLPIMKEPRRLITTAAD